MFVNVLSMSNSNSEWCRYVMAQFTGLTGRPWAPPIRFCCAFPFYPIDGNIIEGADIECGATAPGETPCVAKLSLIRVIEIKPAHDALASCDRIFGLCALRIPLGLAGGLWCPVWGSLSVIP